MTAIRRVVTGLNAEGRSCALFDGSVARPEHGITANVWRSATPLPANNDGARDEGLAPFAMDQLKGPGSSFMLVEYPPGMGADDPHMHATDTLDYMVVIRGEVTLVLETGDVVLRAGDLLVDRGIVHGWRNDSDAPAVAAVVNLPARPVGAGGIQ